MVSIFFLSGEVFVAFIVLDMRAWMRTLFWIWNLSSNRTCFACLMFDFFCVYVCQSVWSHLATGSFGQVYSSHHKQKYICSVWLCRSDHPPPPKCDQFFKASWHGHIAFHHICWLGMLFSFQVLKSQQFWPLFFMFSVWFLPTFLV